MASKKLDFFKFLTKSTKQIVAFKGTREIADLIWAKNIEDSYYF